jgi:hypothetical protein
MNEYIAIEIQSALQCAKKAYRALISTYVNPDDSRAIAETAVPESIREAVKNLHVTIEHLENAMFSPHATSQL